MREPTTIEVVLKADQITARHGEAAFRAPISGPEGASAALAELKAWLRARPKGPKRECFVTYEGVRTSKEQGGRLLFAAWLQKVMFGVEV